VSNTSKYSVINPLSVFNGSRYPYNQLINGYFLIWILNITDRGLHHQSKSPNALPILSINSEHNDFQIFMSYRQNIQ
jgi:hypothetical protein